MTILGLVGWFAVILGMLWLAGRLVIHSPGRELPRDWCEPT